MMDDENDEYDEYDGWWMNDTGWWMMNIMNDDAW